MNSRLTFAPDLRLSEFLKIDNHARYYVFFQLRRDILTGRQPPPTLMSSSVLLSLKSSLAMRPHKSMTKVSRTERTDGFGGGDFVPGPLATVNLQEDEGPRHSEKKSRQLRRTLT
uniref:FERM domain-containing protein n=1 Tax=Caenorhabditis japonica TaxID=281687 RepID=A0A8R1DNV0_CAEJA